MSVWVVSTSWLLRISPPWTFMYTFYMDMSFPVLLGIHLGLELLAHRVTLISAGTARLFYTTSQSHLQKLCFGLHWLKSVCRCWPFIWALSPIWSDVSEEHADRITGLNSAQPEKTCYGLLCLSSNKIQNRVQSRIWVLEAERDLAQGEQFRIVPILLCVPFGERLRQRFECKSFSWEVSPGNPFVRNEGSETSKGRKSVRGVSSSRLPLWATRAQFSWEL